MVKMMERQSSIEKEPRTLNIRQIEFAREAAQQVVETSSIEEALRIFTQGLEPVVRCPEGTGVMMNNDWQHQELDEELWRVNHSRRPHHHHYHQSTISSTCSPEVLIRDIVTAPF